MTASRASTDANYDCATVGRQQSGRNAHDVAGHAHAGGHDHGHGHGHHHHHADASARGLRFALAITAVFFVVEVVGGFMSNSLALLADAGHNLTDVAALALSLFVAWLARQPATPGKTYGYLRWEILAALINSAALLLISALIIWEAVQRMRAPEPVSTGLMLVVAAAGLVANLVAAVALQAGAKHSLNVRGAYLHMLADLLGSVAAVVAGLLIRYFGWTLADPIASVIMTLLILRGSWGLLKESVDVLLEATPRHLDLGDVRRGLEGVPGVESVHDLHVWTLTSGVVALSAHALVRDEARHQGALEAMTAAAAAMGIHHTTIQLETRALAECPPDGGLLAADPAPAR